MFACSIQTFFFFLYRLLYNALPFPPGDVEMCFVYLKAQVMLANDPNSGVWSFFPVE